MMSIRTLKHATSDEGMSLIEVMVALMVFAVIALGVGASSLTILRMTEDTRSRQVASNLATSELDAVRGLPDPFKVTNVPVREVVVSGITYTVTRLTSWVDTSGADIGCGSGNGLLKSKRVNVEVRWVGMLSTTSPVRSDTLISPENRINDPSLGTIRVSVLNSGGTGFSGATVTITPQGSTGAVLDEQPAPTDSDGCSFALKVTPGSYTVSISRAGGVSTTHATSSSTAVTVAAGGSVGAAFQYDLASTYSLNYANNYAGPAPKFPIDLNTTYFASLGSYIETGRKAQTSLFPSTSGYVGIAGNYVAPVAGTAGCISVDPLSWSQGTVAGVALADGARPAPVAAKPNTTYSMGIPMGVLTVKSTGVGTLTAVSATPPSGLGDPGCASPMTYSFGQVLINGSTTIALPFGSWTLSSTNSSGTKSAITGANVAVNTRGSVTANTVTLDPRLPR